MSAAAAHSIQEALEAARLDDGERARAMNALRGSEVLAATWPANPAELRTLLNSSGVRALAVFTDERQLEEAAIRYAWLGPDGRVPMRRLTMAEAIRTAREQLVALVIVDIASPHALELEQGELEMVAAPRSTRPPSSAALGALVTSVLPDQGPAVQRVSSRPPPVRESGRAWRDSRAGAYGAALRVPDAAQLRGARGSLPSDLVSRPSLANRASLVNDLGAAARPSLANETPTGLRHGFDDDVPTARASLPNDTPTGLRPASNDTTSHPALPNEPPSSTRSSLPSSGSRPPASLADSGVRRPSTPNSHRPSLVNVDEEHHSVAATFGAAQTATMTALPAAPSDEIVNALTHVLREYCEVEWACFAGASEPHAFSVVLRVLPALRNNLSDIGAKLRQASAQHGQSCDVLVLDTADQTKRARAVGLPFYPWRKR